MRRFIRIDLRFALFNREDDSASRASLSRHNDVSALKLSWLRAWTLMLAVVAIPRALNLIPLATLAAIVASQALISGAFSLTQQAMQLGYTPRVTIVHTSKQQRGQIYIPEINQALAVGTLVLVLTFQSATALGAAYGVAVTGTMAITTVLFHAVARAATLFTETLALLQNIGATTIADALALPPGLAHGLGPHPVPQSDPRTRGLISASYGAVGAELAFP